MASKAWEFDTPVPSATAMQHELSPVEYLHGAFEGRYDTPSIAAILDMHEQDVQAVSFMKFNTKIFV